jgi:parvulin-like peptidyl-prolyl isomerase
MRKLVILLWAALAFTLCTKPTDRPVAAVNGEPITVGQLAAALPPRVDSTANMDSIRHSVLDALINKKLFVQEATREGMESDIQYQLELEKRGVMNQELYNTIVEPGNRLNEMDLQTSYKLLGTEAHLRVIAVMTETLAQRIAADLDRGVPFETLAVRYSQHPSAQSGGDLGFIPELYIDEPMRSKVLLLKPGRHTAPTAVGQDWQVVLLVETRPNSNVPPLGEFRQELEMRLKQQRRRELANNYLDDVRRRLEYDPKGLEVLTRKPVDSITDAEKELPVATKDGTKYVKVERLLKVAAKFPPGLDTAMKTYAVKREVEEDLLYQEALDRKLDRKPDVVQQLARRRDDVLYQALFKKEISDKLNVTDPDVLAYWHENRDKFPSPDSTAAAGMIRNRLLTGQREARLQEYLTGLRSKARIHVNEKLLATVRRELPRPQPQKPGQ